MNNSLGKYAAEQKALRFSTPQNQKTPGRTDEVQNNAGGFTFKASDKSRLERFLILGTDGGTYYVDEQSFTHENIEFLKDMIRRSERMVVDTVVDVSVNGRAPKNSPALFTLAVVMNEGIDKAYAREAVQKVARTSTHLFEYAQYIDDLGGWGRAKRQSISDWYKSKDVDSLAYQAVKYRSRNGVSHRDLFRLSHPKGIDRRVGTFILKGESPETVEGDIIDGFMKIQKSNSVFDVLAVLEENPRLPWEAIPTQFLRDAIVWKTLFYNGALGQTALLRNVKRFARIGAFDDMMFAGDVAKQLSNADAIRKGRVHPVSYLNALFIYTKGEFARGGWSSARSKNWNVNAKIGGALEAGFYNAFESVESANKRTMVSIDVSSSMTWNAPGGLVGLNCFEAAAAMAMVIVRSEPYSVVNGFSRTLKDPGISDSDSLETVMNKLGSISMGGTDCAQPMLFAAQNNIEVDTFTVWTDNETWFGAVKPFQALRQYRQKTGIDAKLVVVGLEGNEFTIADPQDNGMLDVVGLDASAIKVMTEFSAGRV